MARRAILFITNATSFSLVPDCPPASANSPTYRCYQMDMWWFSTIGSQNFKPFEVRYGGGGETEDDDGLMLFQVVNPGNANQKGPAFVLHAQSDGSSRHFLAVQTQAAGSGLLNEYHAIATCIDSAAHAVPDPNDLNWYPLSTLPNNTGIPIGYPTSYPLPPSPNQTSNKGKNYENTTKPPPGYPNGIIEQDGMLFGLALVDLKVMFPTGTDADTYAQSISNYNLTYPQARNLQIALRNATFGTTTT